MKKYKLGIILPSINPEKWASLFNQISQSVGKYNYEVIAIGPFLPDKTLQNQSNFRYIQDFGSPTRCLMIASYLLDSQYITWLPDDCILENNGYEKCIDLLNSKTEKDGITVLYSEGPKFTGTQHLEPQYWLARTHKDLQLPLVGEGWKIAPIFIYNLDFFREIGGLSVNFEHLNLNCHDLAFRVQKNNGTMFLSPTRIFASDWHPWTDIQSQKSPIQLAYELNDKPLFDKMFGKDSTYQLELKISYDGWRNSDSVWKRRFKEI